MAENVLHCRDNLEILATMEKESVDLIYIDPPFFSNRHYEIICGDEAEIRSFEDRWKGGPGINQGAKYFTSPCRRRLNDPGEFFC